MLKKSISVLMLGGLLIQPLPAHAAREGHIYWGGGWRGGYVHRVGPGYFPVFVGESEYLYSDGLFYNYTPAGYILVEPPVGAVIPALPVGYTAVTVQQTPYYLYNGIYYTTAPSGYTVVQPPPAVPAPIPVVPPHVVAPTASAPEIPHATETIVNDDYDIYVPNQDGTYTLVKLKKTDKGFVGPQGEVYAQHPTVKELEARYSKPIEAKTSVEAKPSVKL